VALQQQEEDWAVTAAEAFAQSASKKGLKVPTEAIADVFRQIETVEIDLSDIERVYSTEEAACFFGKSTAWLYWAMKSREEGGGGLFYYPDGRPIEPERVGVKGIRRFSLDIIKNMSISLYQRRTIRLDELQEIVKRIRLARLGRWEPNPDKKPKGKRGSTSGDSGGAQ
jgi:hypothetical protein